METKRKSAHITVIDTYTGEMAFDLFLSGTNGRYSANIESVPFDVSKQVLVQYALALLKLAETLKD